MPRPKKPRPPRPQHQPHCKYYQGEPPANAAILDVRSQEGSEATEAEARRCRLQLQRLPALTIRRQLQVQWGPTVSLPQPGESPPPGPAPGHNVRLFEVRHGDAQATAAAASTSGQTFVVQKQAEPRSLQQPLTGPFRPVDVSPLRELPPEQPSVPAPPPPPPQPQPPPPVVPSPSPKPLSSPRSSSQVRQQTSAAKLPVRARPSRHAAARTTRGQTPAVTIPSSRHSHLCGSRGAARSRVAPSPSPTPSGHCQVAAHSPSRHSSARRTTPARRASPGAGTAAARGSAPGPTASRPGRDAVATGTRPTRRAPARVDVTATLLPPSVQGGLVPGDHPDALLQELSATAEARRIATEGVSDSADEAPGGEHEARPFGEMPAADMEGPDLCVAGRAYGHGDGDADLWSSAQRIRRQQEVAEIEHRVLDLIGARVVAGLLNMDRNLEIDNWGQYGMQQPSPSDEVVGEHRVLGEGISLEETEIRTPINYDDYLDQAPADNEAEYKGTEKGDSADSGSPDYEDDFEEEEEEADNQESPAVFGHTREKEPEAQKLSSIPKMQVDSESLKDDKLGQGTPEVEATPPSPEPAAPSPPPALSSPTRTPPSPGRFGTVRIRSRRTGGVTTISLPLPDPVHVPTPTPTPVSSPECGRPRATRCAVTPQRSPSPRSGEGDRVPTPPPSPEHARERVTLYKWRSRIEAPPAPALTPPASPPPAPALTPPASPPPAPASAFSFTPEGASPRSSPPLLTEGAATNDTPAEPPLTGARRQTSGEVQAMTEAPVVPAGYGRTLGASLTSSSSLAYSSSLSSNPQVQSQDSLSWGEVRPLRDPSSSADTQLSQGEVASGAVREPVWLCSSLSEGEVVSRHRCSKAPSSHRQAMAESGRSLETSAAGAAAGRRENGGTRKDLSEGEVSEGLVPAALPYGLPDDTDSTSASEVS